MTFVDNWSVNFERVRSSMMTSTEIKKKLSNRIGQPNAERQIM